MCGLLTQKTPRALCAGEDEWELRQQEGRLSGARPRVGPAAPELTGTRAPARQLPERGWAQRPPGARRVLPSAQSRTMECGKEVLINHSSGVLINI